MSTTFIVLAVIVATALFAYFGFKQWLRKQMNQGIIHMIAVILMLLGIASVFATTIIVGGYIGLFSVAGGLVGAIFALAVYLGAPWQVLVALGVAMGTAAGGVIAYRNRAI